MLKIKFTFFCVAAWVSDLSLKAAAPVITSPTPQYRHCEILIPTTELNHIKLSAAKLYNDYNHGCQWKLVAHEDLKPCSLFQRHNILDCCVHVNHVPIVLSVDTVGRTRYFHKLTHQNLIFLMATENVGDSDMLVAIKFHVPAHLLLMYSAGPDRDEFYLIRKVPKSEAALYKYYPNPLDIQLSTQLYYNSALQYMLHEMDIAKKTALISRQDGVFSGVYLGIQAALIVCIFITTISLML